MKIKAIGNKIHLNIEEPAAGALAIASMPTAIECGTVIGIGEQVKLPVKKGDKLFFKSWAVDIITYNAKRHFFISEDTNGICAIVTE